VRLRDLLTPFFAGWYTAPPFEKDLLMKIPLPAKDELLEYLVSFDFFERFGGGSQAGRDYATYHLQRFIRTMELIPQMRGTVRVLELGASPYFMTVLVEKHLGYKMTVANFYGDYGEAPAHPEDQITLTSARYNESYNYQYKMFNVERDPYPYPDREFDMVLCCEILEHLAIDPSFMLREIHRVLKPGGCLFLTTPNAVRLANVFNLMSGRNIYFPYSTDGVYGRHNREYTVGEITDLLRLHNFEPNVIADDAYPHDPFFDWFTATNEMKGRGDNLFAIGRTYGSPVRQYPDWLYAGYKKRPAD
jgi:SAM-dependent methyltransferase